MAACPATIYALNVYGNSLQRFNFDQQQLFNDLIVRILQVECAGAPQDLSHNTSMPLTHVASDSGQSPSNLAVTNPVVNFAIFDGATQHVSVTSPSSTFIQPGDTTQRNHVEEPSSIITQSSHYHHPDNDDSSVVQLDNEYKDNIGSLWQDGAPSAPASSARLSSTQELGDMRKEPDCQCPDPALVPIAGQRPVMIPAKLDLSNTDASVFPPKVFDLVVGYLQPKDLINLSLSCRSCLQTVSLATTQSVVYETSSTQSRSSCGDKIAKVDLNTTTTPVPQPVINNIDVTTPVPLEPKKATAQFTTGSRVNKFRKNVRRSSRIVPSIMLPPVTRSGRLYIEGPEPDRELLGIDDEEEEDSSDDEDDDQQNDFSMTFLYRQDSHDADFVSVDWEDIKSLLKYCPYSLTYSGRTCPLGDDCILQKVCHRNSNPVGCSQTPCPYSHDVRVSCRTFMENRRCKHTACTYSHDYELRTAIKDTIDNHVKHRSFGAKIQAVQEEENSGKEDKVN
ncbi:hypothetical protein KCU71_g7106, partial [Aureobasidium melanogenum]